MTKKLNEIEEEGEYELFNPPDYIENPVALGRIIAYASQKALAKRMNVT